MNKVIIIGKFKKTTGQNNLEKTYIVCRKNETATEDIEVFMPPEITRPEPGAYVWCEGALYTSKRGFLGCRITTWRTLDGKARSSRVVSPAPAPGTEDNVPF